VNRGPEFCGTVPRSAGSLFLAGEARRKCAGLARPVRLPIGNGTGRGTTSTSCKHLSDILSPDFHDDYPPLPGQVKLPKSWWHELVAAECDTDRLASAANITRDTDGGPNTRQLSGALRARRGAGKCPGGSASGGCRGRIFVSVVRAPRAAVGPENSVRR
jgi:hypothetical protein